MGIIANPPEKRVSITVGDSRVVMVYRSPTTKELTKFLNKRFSHRGRKIKDESMEARIEFSKLLLKDIEAYGPSGDRDQVSYLDGQGKEQILSPTVEGWLEYVNVTWHIAGAIEFEVVEVEAEEDLKN